MFLQNEEGTDAVEEALVGSTRCAVANWSEVAQKVIRPGQWSLARALLTSYGVRVEPVIADDAERAAHRWRRGEGPSLADRLYLALGERLDIHVLTADRAWGCGDRVRQIR